MSRRIERLLRSATVAVLSAAVLSACSANDAGSNVPPFAAQIIALVQARDAVGLTALAELQSRACEVSVESDNQCAGRDPAGTIYRVFPAAACEGYWTRNVGLLMEAAVKSAGPPDAVARPGTVPQWAIDTDYPYGNQVVIFEALTDKAIPQAVALYLDTKSVRIVHAQIGCRRADQFLEPGSFEEAPTVIWRAPVDS
ncbi:MAG: hypothetical protein O3B31_15060 [Chloroflexi bacterium]|nr:hypothetical protein [Chloroflexota bacterium]MDA1004642.1 hypothetical protein [Chloroflexota bacterium]